MRAALLLLLAFSMLTISACSQEDTGEFYTQWDLAGACLSDHGEARLNGLGTPTDICDSTGQGHWVWVTYAAGWCSASRGQALPIRQLDQASSENITVFTVLTSGNQVFTDATLADGSGWANAHVLAPEQVLIESATSRTLPQHLLLGPDGRTWYRYVGQLDVDEMVTLVDAFASGQRQPQVRDLGIL